MPNVGDFHPPAYRHITAYDAMPLRHHAPQAPEPQGVDIDVPLAEGRAQRLQEDRRVAAALTNVDAPRISDAEVRRAARVMLDCRVTGESLLVVRADLDRPFVPGVASNNAVTDAGRRIFLVAMLQISTNRDRQECLDLIDRARAMPSGKVGEFIFREVIILSRAATAASGTSFVASASLAGASAKLAALKVGALPVMHLLGGAAVCAGLSACGLSMICIGAACLRSAFLEDRRNRFDNWDIFEATWNKDRRIMKSIHEGRAIGANPCPLDERPHV